MAEGPTIITISLIEAAYAYAAAQEEAELDPRTPPTESARAFAQKHGGFDTPADPLPVIMLDEIRHTPASPICDGGEECCCYRHEMEPTEQPEPKRRHSTLFVSSPPVGLNAPLNGNREFRLFR